MTPPTPLEDLARLALDGDRDALDRLVREMQGDVYGLALRMLWNREDAEDATQEILVRTVTRLSQFDFRSTLKTWVYRIAVNYVLDVKRSPVERMHLTFERFADDLANGLSSDGPADAERSLLTEEVKIGCTLGMLQCLDRPHRLAYVLGEILELSGPEAAEALEMSPELSASGCSTLERRSSRSRARTAASRRTAPSVPATGECLRRCAAGAPIQTHSISRIRQRRMRKPAVSFAGSSTRDGRSRSTARAIRGRRRSTSRGGSRSHSTLLEVGSPPESHHDPDPRGKAAVHSSIGVRRTKRHRLRRCHSRRRMPNHVRRLRDCRGTTNLARRPLHRDGERCPSEYRRARPERRQALSRRASQPHRRAYARRLRIPGDRCDRASRRASWIQRRSTCQRGRSRADRVGRACGGSDRVGCRWQARRHSAPDQHDQIWAAQKLLDFPRFVYGVERAPEGRTNMPEITRKRSASLGRHREDVIDVL